MVYAHPLDAKGLPLGWFEQADLATGPSVRQAISDPDGNSYLSVAGAADPNGDGRDEAFVIFHKGASNDFLGVVAVGGSHLVRTALLKAGTSSPLTISVGGSVMFGSGASCAALGGVPMLQIWGLGRTDATHYDWDELVYRWVGTNVQLAGRRSGVLVSHGDNDPRLEKFYFLRCGALTAD